ncbi:unnamed protein product [Ranitomeya imitator]|uniref:Reverse transcriptase domain-containing protein n=1 Tax=Ranitomeya imitator TaxID=111125 RepID=A0ABN9LW65_9NEOB|nr:unnamed protein product [Ranitomeya imitator]
MDRADYIKEAYRQLGDSTVYIKLSRDPINDIRNDISSILRTYLDLGVIDSKTKDFLIKANPVTPVLYLLPKVHKSLVNPPGRPIIAATESILSPISIFLEKVLTPLTQKSQSYLLDTGAFLKTLHTIGTVSDDSYLVSFDVKDLYTSIPHDKGIDCVRRLLVTSKLDPRTIDLCLELLKVVLTRNYFLFEDNYYLQAQGTAMGSNMAPPYANTYMATFEEEVIYPNDLFKAHCITWKRYIDDIFCIWTGTLDSLNEFFETLNHSWSGLSFTITKDTQQISFLDTMVIKDASGTLSTDLYRKPTDRNSLLYYTSLHPASTRNAIPRSQFQRVDKLVSDHTKKQVRIDEMYHKFRERGYPPNVLHDALQPRKRSFVTHLFGPYNISTLIGFTYHNEKPTLDFFHTLPLLGPTYGYWSFRLETRESKIFSTIYSNSPSTKTGAGGSIDGTTGATYLRNNDLWNTLWMEKEAGRVKRKDTGLRTSEILYGPMKRGLNLGEETFIGI